MTSKRSLFRKQTSKRLALAVVNELFTNGANEHGDRLVLTSADGRDLGGWGKNAVACVVQRILDGALRPESPEGDVSP